MAHNLTPREQQVYALVVDGWSNQSIAKKLNISIKTTEKHVSMLLLKCDQPSRTKLAVEYWKLQLKQK